MALSQSFAFVVVLIFAIQSGCLAAKFAMISMKGRSHYLVLERLGKELESRGHEVNSVCVKSCNTKLLRNEVCNTQYSC